MTADWLSAHGEATSRLTDVAQELCHLSRAFGGTGNFHMEDVLLKLAQEVSENSHAASVAVTRSINESYERSRADLAETLGAVLEHTLTREPRA